MTNDNILQRSGLIAKCSYALLLLLALSSCVPDTVCRLGMDVRLKVVMQGDSVSERGQTIRYSSFDCISVVPVDYDSLVYNNSTNISSLLLPLKDDTTLTQYLLTYRGKTDTLTILHTNEMNFIDMACGCVCYHTIDSISYTTHWMDEVELINQQVVRQPMDNLKIHLHGIK